MIIHTREMRLVRWCETVIRFRFPSDVSRSGRHRRQRCVDSSRDARHTTTRDGYRFDDNVALFGDERTNERRKRSTHTARRSIDTRALVSLSTETRIERDSAPTNRRHDERSVQQKEQRRGACEATTATSVDDGCDACGSSSTMTRPSGRPRPRLGSTEYRRRHREANTAGAGGHASSSTSRGPPPLAREPVRLVRRPGGFAF